MNEIVFLSGKGGTGKTSLTAAFASLADNPVICDGDVDAADLHLLLRPEIKKTTGFYGGGVANIDTTRCNACNLCRQLCRFDAINSDYRIDTLSCEGCGVCVDLCPEQAINYVKKKCGEWFISDTHLGPLVHARLGIAEENSGKLVSQVRKEARSLGEHSSRNLIITDGPPGIGCPVIASVTGASLVVLVVEPTISGLHDLKRVAELTKHFGVATAVLINKYDLNQAVTDQITRYAKKSETAIVGILPFDTSFVHAMVQGKNIFEYGQCPELLLKTGHIWGNIQTLLHNIRIGTTQPINLKIL